jgi:hypothetical protein
MDSRGDGRRRVGDVWGALAIVVEGRLLGVYNAAGRHFRGCGGVSMLWCGCQVSGASSTGRVTDVMGGGPCGHAWEKMRERVKWKRFICVSIVFRRRYSLAQRPLSALPSLGRCLSRRNGVRLTNRLQSSGLSLDDNRQ